MTWQMSSGYMPRAAPRKLEDVNQCFDEVLSGQVPARLVFTF
jgi:hypothetical protein